MEDFEWRTRRLNSKSPPEPGRSHPYRVPEVVGIAHALGYGTCGRVIELQLAATTRRMWLLGKRIPPHTGHHRSPPGGVGGLRHVEAQKMPSGG